MLKYNDINELRKKGYTHVYLKVHSVADVGLLEALKISHLLITLARWGKNG